MAGQRLDLTDLERDGFGRLYLLDAEGKKVLRLGLDRRTVETAVQGAWKKAAALALDALGNFYVLDRGNRRIEVYDARGKLTGAAGPILGGGIELRDPQDLAVDGSGRLVLTDRKLPFVVVLEWDQLFAGGFSGPTVPPTAKGGHEGRPAKGGNLRV